MSLLLPIDQRRAAEAIYADALVAYISKPTIETERAVIEAVTATRQGHNWAHDAKLLKRHLESARIVAADKGRTKREADTAGSAFAKLERDINQQIADLQTTLRQARVKLDAQQANTKDIARRELELQIAKGEVTRVEDGDPVKITALPGLILSGPATAALRKLMEGIK